MGINLTSGAGFTSGVVIADTGANDATQSTLTQVDGLPIAAALEIKSTQGAFVLPRMTTVQRNALANASSAVTNGMLIFNTDTQTVNSYSNGNWGEEGQIAKTVTLNQAQILALNSGAAGVVPLLIPAPGAGSFIFVNKAVLVNKFAVAAFATGGPVSIGYGTTAAGVAALPATSATIPAAFITSAATSVKAGNQNTATYLRTDIENQPISIGATVDFTAGNAASTLVINLYYSILPF